MHLHWDGDNDSVDERNLSAALGAGVTPVTVDHAALKRVRDWIWTLPPPEYPYAIDADAGRARRAASTSSTASTCHADHRFRDGVKIGRARRPGGGHRRASARIGIGSIRTPPVVRRQPVRALSRIRRTGSRTSARPTATPTIRSTASGCAAPYLHNGSVPTLRDLLEPPERRPGGVLSRLRRVRSAERRLRRRTCRRPTGRRFFRYDTTVPGNGNGGHVYGTTLPDADKRAIVEYLKTF